MRTAVSLSVSNCLQELAGGSARISLENRGQFQQFHSRFLSMRFGSASLSSSKPVLSDPGSRNSADLSQYQIGHSKCADVTPASPFSRRITVLSDTAIRLAKSLTDIRRFNRAVLISASRALTIEMLHQTLHTRVDEVDFEQANADVKPFFSNVDGLEVWSEGYFHQLMNKVFGVNS